MGKVYVIQEPTRMTEGELRPSMDLTPALEYGELIMCLPPGPVSLSPAPVEDRLHDCLRHFSDDDCLLAVGDPSAMVAAGAIASHNNNGRFSVLKWDRRSRRYIKVIYDVHRRHRKAV